MQLLRTIFSQGMPGDAVRPDDMERPMTRYPSESEIFGANFFSGAVIAATFFLLLAVLASTGPKIAPKSGVPGDLAQNGTAIGLQAESAS